MPCSGSRPRSTRFDSSAVATVAFSVEPSHNPSGYYELAFALANTAPEDINITPTTDTYSRDDFTADIRVALVEAFGAGAVKDGDVAYRVREQQTILPADVVPSWEYRRYDSLVNGVPICHKGARIYPAFGGYRNNYPTTQLTNGTAKNKSTGYRYK